MGITRLQITVAKIQQSLPEMKRNGKTVLSAIASEQLYDETSTARAGNLLKQAEFIPGLIQQLQNEPKKVTEEFELIRKTRELSRMVFNVLTGEPSFSPVTKPEGVRFSVTGNILGVQNPKKPWREHFGNLVSPQGRSLNPPGTMGFNHPQNQTVLQPVPFSNETLSAVGKKPANKVQTTLRGRS